MKIAQLNTLNHGGAFVVTNRLQEALLKLKYDSILFTKYGVAGRNSNHYYLKDDRFRNFLRKNLSNPVISHLVKIVQQVSVHPNLANRPKGFEIFSPLYTRKLDSQLDLLNDRDIIHLHWINDFINMEAFFLKFSSKKFVWTLHDMNPITGGCHHADECSRFKSECKPCPQLTGTIDEDYALKAQGVKIRALQVLGDDQLVIVSPSHWLLDLSKKSKITSRFKHVLILNPTFQHAPITETREFIRRGLGFDQSKKIVLFVSDNLNNPRKGIQLLFNAMLAISRKEDIVLLGIGHKAEVVDGVNIFYTGKITDIDLLARYFYAADLFVTPSMAENSPLVVIEALTCGTPVVASDVGGIPELITNQNGLLFPTGQISGLTNAISSGLFERIFDRDAIKTKALQMYDPTAVAKEYLSVYDDISSK